MDFDVNESADRENGRRRIEWAAREMPVLLRIRERFRRQRVLEGIRISACLHITSETANLAITLRDGGASVALCASNPLSTSDEVALSLVKDEDISVFGIHDEDNDTYYRHVHQALDRQPAITMDDGGDLVSTIHRDRTELIPGIMGGTEETTTGVKRFRNMERDGVLRYPIIAVNDAYTKYLFDNRYGTGQSTLDGILRATNVLLAGKKMVVAGYGWCGRGISMRARGMGAHVIVTEVDPTRALEAMMDGFRVMPMKEAAPLGDIFVTATGNTSVIDREHMEEMKDGALLANSGHFNVEIDPEALAEFTVETRIARRNVVEHRLRNGRSIFLLGEGRLINLAAAEGHPASVMDLSFANQALCAEHLNTCHSEMENRVYRVPEKIDGNVAALKLASMGVEIDELSPEQIGYLGSWESGT